MAEGKTLVPGVPCDLCDGDDSVNFCTNCQQDLCLRCSTAHRKIPDLSHHKLRPITDKTSGVVPKTTQAYCNKHPSKPLSVICEVCLKALCGTCADAEHRNHKLLRTNLNAELLHRICVQKVPEFLDLLQKLDKEKDGSPLKLHLYKQARDMVKTWRDHIWKIIEDDSKELLKKIEKEIKNQEILSADISSNLKDAVGTTEQQMSVLSNARKISDTGTLLANIQNGDKIIEKAKTLLEEIEDTRMFYTIDDLLPSRNELRNLETNLHTFFTMADITSKTIMKSTNASSCIGKTTEARRTYHSMRNIENHYIGQPGGGHFRIIESCCRSAHEMIFIYDAFTPYLYEFELKSKETHTFTCQRNILHMAILSTTRLVMIENNNRFVHLLGGSLKIVSTHRYKGNPFAVCPVSHDKFILAENVTESGRSRVRFSMVSVSNSNTLCTQKLCEDNVTSKMGLLSLHLKQIIMNSVDIIYSVDLTTGKFTKIDLLGQFGIKATNIYVDKDDQILVGDAMGKIHLMSTTHYKGELQLMEGTGNVSGISIRGDKVVIVAGEYISIYQ